MSHIVLYWLLTAVVIAVGIITIVRLKRLGWLFRFVGGAGALAIGIGCLCNTLVITANGGRMPVETGLDWNHAPSILSGASQDNLLRRFLEGTLSTESKFQPAGIHQEVEAGPEAAAKVRLAWLDDRYPLIVGDSHITYSPGDVFIAAGAGALLLCFAAAAIAVLGRLVLRKKRA